MTDVAVAQKLTLLCRRHGRYRHVRCIAEQSDARCPFKEVGMEIACSKVKVMDWLNIMEAAAKEARGD